MRIRSKTFTCYCHCLGIHWKFLRILHEQICWENLTIIHNYSLIGQLLNPAIVPRALLVWGQLPKQGKLHKALTSESVEKEMLIAAVLPESDLEHVKFYLHPSLYQLNLKVPKTCKEGISPLNVVFSGRISLGKYDFWDLGIIYYTWVVSLYHWMHIYMYVYK